MSGTKIISKTGGAKSKKAGKKKFSIPLKRLFTRSGVSPLKEVNWVKRDAVVGSADKKFFEQKEVEFPDFWSLNAISITVAKYFRGKLGTPERETGLKQMIARVAREIRGWGEKYGYFASANQAQIFEDELTHILLHQKGSFNSPVWFNVGVREKPQCAACFILSVEDDMRAILDWIKTEGIIFKGGSGAGVNLSNLRSKTEQLSQGGYASGPVSFMRGADSVAGMIKSGGTTRRAAKMVVLNIEHPDAIDFIRAKAEEEKKVRALIDAGYNMADLNNEAWNSIQFQNANNSIRIPDEFMEAVERDGDWETKFITNGETAKKYKARELLSEVAKAAWECGDPGVQFDTTINKWHTCPMSGRINASNPCFAGDTLVSTDRGLLPFADLHKLSIRGEKFRVYTDNRTADSPVNAAEATLPEQVMVTGVNDVYRLRFSNGLEVRATKNHRFFTKNRGMVRADELTPEDEITISNRQLDFPGASLKLILDVQKILASGWGRRDTKQFKSISLPAVWTTPLAEYMGYVVGDGSVRIAADSKYRLSSVSAVFGDETEASQLVPRFTELFASWGVDTWQRLNMPNGTVQLRVNRTPVARMLSELGVSTKRAHEKTVPASIYQAPQTIQTAFLRGLFTADGCVYDGQKHRYVGLSSASRELLSGVQQLLLAQGVFSHIYQNQNRKSSFSYIRKNGEQISYTSKPAYDLRISGKSILNFKEKIGFLTDAKQSKLAKLISEHDFYEVADDTVRFEAIIYDGREFTYNLTEPKNHSYIANGLVAANCSEYMHLDNSACNLASINLMKFLREDGTFMVNEFKHTVDVFILAQDIIVGGSSYPTEKIGENANKFRELGLGFGNLGALLMDKGIPYDSEESCAWAGAIASLMSGEAYRFSAKIAERMKPFEGYAVNREPMLEVIKNHGSESKKIKLNNLDDKKLGTEAIRVWDEALALGNELGFRNSQATVIAPTGTISFMMDFDTTGIEPEFSLVKMKQLVGGGWMRIVNTGVENALLKLGYSEADTKGIIGYVSENGMVEGAPGLKEEHLAIFDCAVKPAKGTRAISWKGHVKIVAAVQPFMSGAISKTFNMSHDVTKEEIEEAYVMAWKMGIKAFAVYRDGSKATQPLNTSENKKEKKDLKIVGEALRKRLPATRASKTHKFSIAGHDGYLTYSTYEDGNVAEIFIKMAKQGSTLAGLLDAFAISVSMALQYGVPLKALAHKFIYSRFEPAGFTENPDIRIATSIIDYIFRYLGLAFLSEDELAEFGMERHLMEDHSVEKSNEPTRVTVTAAIKTADNEVNSAPKKNGNSVPGETVCRKCGGMMVRTGTCLTCLQCGDSSGGCS